MMMMVITALMTGTRKQELMCSLPLHCALPSLGWCSRAEVKGALLACQEANCLHGYSKAFSAHVLHALLCHGLQHCQSLMTTYASVSYDTQMTLHLAPGRECCCSQVM